MFELQTLESIKQQEFTSFFGHNFKSLIRKEIRIPESEQIYNYEIHKIVKLAKLIQLTII